MLIIYDNLCNLWQKKLIYTLMRNNLSFCLEHCGYPPLPFRWRGIKKREARKIKLKLFPFEI